MRKTRSVSLTLALVLAALPAVNGGAATLNVPSTSYPTIQSAIDGAIDGVDEVVVGDGTYTGAGNTRLDFLGKDITVRSANGAASTVIDCGYEAGCWGVRFVGDETAAVFEGFTLTRATASAVLIEGTTAKSPRIVDCVLDRNRASAGSDGGGIRIFGAASVTVAGCSFRQNSSFIGGGFYIDEGTSSLASAVISGCTFWGNSAMAGGGAIGIAQVERVEIRECRFEKNSGGEAGGAIYSPSSPVTVSRSVFIGNRAGGAGGAIYGSYLTLHDTLLFGNLAFLYGGALHLTNSSVVNCTIADNSANARGGGVYLGDVPPQTGSTVFNSILWGNKASSGGSLYVQMVATVGNCDLEGGLASVGGVTPVKDGGIIDADPQFALPGDYHLLPASPCIDAGAEGRRPGLPATDLEGGPRSVGVVDIGAYEFGISAPDPYAVVSPASLTFGAVEGGARPDPLVLSVINGGYGSLTWAISTSEAWLAADPVSGETAGEEDRVNISVDSAAFSRGVYVGSIEMRDGRTGAVLRTVPVTLVVSGTLKVCQPAGTCAYDAIQDAIDDAEDGDVVLVADGTYTGERNRNLNMRGKAVTVRSENGPQSAVIDCETLGRGFIFESFEGEDSIVQGFTIRNGSPPSGTPFNEHVGGGIFVASGSPRIVDCRLEGNHADRYGGGLGVFSIGGSVHIGNCLFTQNVSGEGGGAYVFGMKHTFSGCRFSGNTALDPVVSEGGGLFLYAIGSTIESCTFEANRADRAGGLYVKDANFEGYDRGNVIRGSRFEGNWAIGRAEVWYSPRGGGVYLSDSTATIANCVFQGNMACRDTSGPSCLKSPDDAPGNGGGAYLLGGGSIVNGTFSGNQAGALGGALYADSTSYEGNPPPAVFNTLFWGNVALGGASSGKDIYDSKNDVLLSHCAFDFNASVNKYGLSMRVEGVDLTANSPPGLVDQAAGDFRLLRSSRCIDKGSTINSLFSDHRGSVRAVDGDIDGLARFDIGAYEYSEYYGGLGEDQTSRAFKNLRINGSVLVTGHEYQVEWSDKEPFPSDRRISQAGEYEVRLALVDAAGLRIDLGTWKVQLSQAGYKIPVSFGADHLGRWRIRLELVADPGQYALSDEIAIWYKTPQVRYLGERITPPADADPSVKPDVQLESVVHWSADTGRLYAIAPSLTVVTWYADEGRAIPLPTVVYIVHPPTPQRHVAGTQPVELLPTGTAFDGVDLMWTDGDATIAGNRFKSSVEGWSVLMYRDNEAADPDDKERFEVVRTLAWDHTSDPAFPNEALWDIGQEVTDGEHDGEECGSGYVFFEAGPYDGHGESRAYDRETRQGQIFGVNDDDTAPGGGDFVVVWYQRSRVADGCWPFKPVRYDLRWPAAPARIVIANQRGSGPLDPADYGALENMLVYDQPDPAFPGYNPNEEHASFFAALGSELPAVYALRADLNRTAAPPYTSEPYVLLKYREPLGGRWQFKVYRVEAEAAPTDLLAYPATAGSGIMPPYPLNQLVFGPCVQSGTVSSVPDEVLRDKDGRFFAVQGEKSVVMRYHYRLQPGFHFDRDGDGVLDASVGTCVPWLDSYAGTPGTPADVTYDVAWPEQTPTLLVGETLTDARTREGETVGLPNIKDQCVVDKLYDEAGVRLIDPLAQHRTALPRSAVAGIRTEPADPLGSSRVLFVDLPFHLQSRLTYDAVEEELRLEGLYRTGVGEPLLLLNTLTERDVAVIRVIPGAAGNTAFLEAVSALKGAGDAGLAGASTLKEARMKALTAGDVHAASPWPYDTPTNTYVTLAFNDDPDCNAPTTLSVLKVGCPLSAGEIKVIEPPNPFDEKVTLRHSGDFGGNSDARWFQWAYHSASASGIPDSPQMNPAGWLPYGDIQPDPLQTGYPPNGPSTGDPWHRGALDTTIQGSGQQLLADKWFSVRYFYRNPSGSVCGETVSAWTEPQLYEGWVKRVMKNVNLFDQKVKDFHASEVDTLASMISLAGKRYEGAVPLSADPGYLQGVGLIELYETLLERGTSLSINAGHNETDMNKAVLLAANRIAGLYLLLGNEAYADAADPTIGFSTEDGQYGAEAPSVFAFQNQSDSLLEEELALLRGRADTGVQPFYNRLVWNFTIDDGEVAYRENYGITDQNRDGEINEQDAMIQFPQGHGDAWGHYLTAVKKYYQLITHDHFTWVPQSEAILVGQVPVSVDYRDERRFAEAAAARARAGSEIVGLTYRERYDEDPEKQWQGYRDEDRSRAWGVDDWAARAGQGSILDWVIGNALLPPDTPDDRQERVFSATAVPCEACPGQTRFELPPQFNHVTLQVAVDGIPQAPGSYAVAGEEDVATGELMAAVTFAAAPNAVSQVSFRIDVAPEGIAKIDRTTVVELREIASHLGAVQAVLDQADAGLNPLGVAKEAVPFDIDPARVAVGETHFEQVYGRAVQAMSNAVVVFDHANQGSQMLRRQQDRLEDFRRNVVNAEADFNNRLIEIFGYPYADDCGAGGTYEAGYCETGPDLYHFMYVDPSELMGVTAPKAHTFAVTFKDIDVDERGALQETEREVLFHADTDSRFGLVKPAAWQGRRKAPGEIQLARSDLLQQRGRFESALLEYGNLLDSIEKQAGLIEAQHGLNRDELLILTRDLARQKSLNSSIMSWRARQLLFRKLGSWALNMSIAVAEALPTSAGFATDFTSAIRSAIRVSGVVSSEVWTGVADAASMMELSHEQAKEIVSAETNIALTALRGDFAVRQGLLQLENLVRSEATLRHELHVQWEGIAQSAMRYLGALARGERLLADRLRFRRQTAAQIQGYRYKDMTFRIFRNDALQKYRAQFDMASRYVYLAAKAYDYETTLLDSSGMAGQGFLAHIVKQRTIGRIVDGQPLAGTGLADPMRRLWQNFQVLKPQLGFSNPQQETNRFSLRSEMFRILPLQDSNGAWRDALKSRRVGDLWQVPEFRRYCRPFAAEGIPEPGIVIPFRTTVTSRLNFFGWPLAAGDSYYGSSNFATKVRSVGVWFSNYNRAGLAQTPRVYLVPAGEDVLRSPTSSRGDIRTWHVVDQKLPVPFPIDAPEMENDPGWIPSVDTIHDEPFQIRRHSDFKAYHDSGYLDKAEMTYDTRLIGRSVWNSRWMLIIPGASLLYDPDEGLDTFIDGPEVVGGRGERSGYGISDIRIFFETYSYSGN